MENIQETITGESLRKRQAFLRLVRKSVLFAMPFWALIAQILIVFNTGIGHRLTYFLLQIRQGHQQSSNLHHP